MFDDKRFNRLLSRRSRRIGRLSPKSAPLRRKGTPLCADDDLLAAMRRPDDFLLD